MSPPLMAPDSVHPAAHKSPTSIIVHNVAHSLSQDRDSAPTAVSPCNQRHRRQRNQGNQSQCHHRSSNHPTRTANNRIKPKPMVCPGMWKDA